MVIALSLVILLLSWQSYSSQKSMLLQDSQEQVQRLAASRPPASATGLPPVVTLSRPLANGRPVPSPQRPATGPGVRPLQLTHFGEGGKMNDSDPSINRDGYDPRSRGWYQEAMAKGGMIVTKPYLDVAYNILVVTWPSRPRAAWWGISIASLVDDITKMKLPADGFAILMHKDGTVISTRMRPRR